MTLPLPLKVLLVWGWWAAPATTDAPPEAPTPETAARADTAEPAPGETAPGEARSAPEGPADPAAPSPSTAPAPTPAPPVQTIPASEQVLERTLPCGLRVLVARDVSLPVAAVVLALESGSEDDPPELPGLHHALAYHLLQGNRDLPPGGIAALVQDGGGIALLATGPGQTRFESLVPVSLLDDVIQAEASRLRAPSVTEALWKDTLASARRDVPRRSVAPRAAVAAAHGAAGLAQDGRQVSRALAELKLEAVEDALAQRARYENATLAVVGPHPPQDTLAVVEAAFADLPQRARNVPVRAVVRAAASVPVRRGNDRTFLWGIQGNPAARLEAAAWCEAINRQRRRGEETKATRLRCTFEDDVRRPHLTLRTQGPEDPQALIDRRLARLTEKRDARLLASQRRRALRRLDEAHAQPLELARALSAQLPTGAVSDTPQVRSRHTLTGRDALAADENLAARPPSAVLRPETAVRLTADPDASTPSRTSRPRKDKAPTP